jgi:predicted transcriptional regulator
MSTITARIPDELNSALSKVAKVMERPKTFLIYKAVEQYIREAEQDIEDAEIALAVMNDKTMKRYTSEEVKARLEARYRSEHNL